MFASLLLILPCFVDSSLIVISNSRSSRNARTSQLLSPLFAAIDGVHGLSYSEPVFRPPAEWRSLILQVTEGCSWNRCTFCEMYQTKQFRMKPLSVLEMELKQVVERRKDGVVLDSMESPIRDVFLADGDAMTLPTPHLVEILKLIHTYLPNVRRISSYCLPRNIRYTSVHDLQLLRDHGLSLVYIGCESGNDQVLKGVQKGETYTSSLDALNKLRDAHIKRSVMILLGLGGTILSKDHAMDSAKLVTATEPEYLSVLTTSFPKGKQRVIDGFQKELKINFEQLTPRQSLEELECFLDHVNIPSSCGKTIFRSDHASNYFVLKGRLGRNKERLLKEVRDVLSAPESDDVYNLRPEWARGL